MDRKLRTLLLINTFHPHLQGKEGPIGGKILDYYMEIELQKWLQCLKYFRNYQGDKT